MSCTMSAQKQRAVSTNKITYLILSHSGQNSTSKKPQTVTPMDLLADIQEIVITEAQKLEQKTTLHIQIIHSNSLQRMIAH